MPRKRAGLSLKELTPEQRLLAHALLASGLSQRGYSKALTIMSLEGVLAALEQRRGPVCVPELYYLSIFGQPGGEEPWGWRVEGHHLSLNFPSAGRLTPSVTPSFLAAIRAKCVRGREPERAFWRSKRTWRASWFIRWIPSNVGNPS